mmetsp:Transcript_57266/g.138355  ORF Transcript_57266/g.138355 Transcript_57266/m.138355 type:complete len:252 (+) Transcript_57266:845-1600(+)
MLAQTVVRGNVAMGASSLVLPVPPPKEHRWRARRPALPARRRRTLRTTLDPPDGHRRATRIRAGGSAPPGIAQAMDSRSAPAGPPAPPGNAARGRRSASFHRSSQSATDSLPRRFKCCSRVCRSSPLSKSTLRARSTRSAGSSAPAVYGKLATTRSLGGGAPPRGRLSMGSLPECPPTPATPPRTAPHTFPRSETGRVSSSPSPPPSAPWARGRCATPPRLFTSGSLSSSRGPSRLPSKGCVRGGHRARRW